MLNFLNHKTDRIISYYNIYILQVLFLIPTTLILFMQGITSFEYKSLLESLCKLRQYEMFDLSDDQAETIIEKENKLKEIYASYLFSLEQVAENIKQFEKHKHSIRRFIKKNRQYIKESKKTIKATVSVG